MVIGPVFRSRLGIRQTTATQVAIAAHVSRGTGDAGGSGSPTRDRNRKDPIRVDSLRNFLEPRLAHELIHLGLRAPPHDPRPPVAVGEHAGDHLHLRVPGLVRVDQVPARRHRLRQARGARCGPGRCRGITRTAPKRSRYPAAAAGGRGRPGRTPRRATNVTFVSPLSAARRGRRPGRRRCGRATTRSRRRPAAPASDSSRYRPGPAAMSTIRTRSPASRRVRRARLLHRLPQVRLAQPEMPRQPIAFR